MFMKKLLITGMSISMTVILGGCSILPKEQSYDNVVYASPYETEYEYAYVKQGDLAQTVKVVCSYVPAGKEDYFFESNDERIGEIFVTKGDQVKRGDLLAELYVDDLENQIAEAEKEVSQLTLKKSYLKREQEIKVQQQAIRIEQASTYERAVMDSTEDVKRSYDEQIRSLDTRIQVLDLEMEQWKQQVEDRKIYSTMDGEVTYTLTVTKDTTSKAANKVVTVSDTSNEFFIAQTEYAKDFTMGKEYVITVDDTDYIGKAVNAADYGIQAKKDTIYFLITGSKDDLKSSSKGTTILTLQEKKNVCYIDKKAVTDLDGKSVVFYLNKDGIRDYKEVTTGFTTDDYIEIEDGVTVGEAVILG